MTTKTSPQRLAYLAMWRNKNRESLRAYQIEWVKNNPEKVKTKAAKYVKLNPQMNSAKTQRYRAKIKDCKTFVISKDELVKLYNQPCNNCGSNDNLAADHIIPISRGGDHSIGNLQTLCKSCNSQKKDRTIMEWRMYNLKAKVGV